MESYLSVC